MLWSETPTLVHGSPGRASIDPAAGYAHIDATHRRECPRASGVAFVRMGAFGVANDVNRVVRGLHVSISRKMQLVLLPPDSQTRAMLPGPNATLDHPWHWLPPQRGLGDMLHLSACHEWLLRHNRSWLQRIEEEGVTDTAARAVPFRIRLLDLPWRTGVRPSELPRAFHGQGILWWWSVLTTYVLRPRGEFARDLLAHPALAAFSSGLGAPFGQPLADLRAGRTISFRNASAPFLFDVGLHLRMGDACGPKARLQRSRHCVKSLRQALLLVAPHVANGSSVFIASDSAAAVADARLGRGAPALRFFHLSFQRGKYDTAQLIELAHIDSESREAILHEALLEMFLLSRARLIAGAMYGNFPRLAMQLRVKTRYEYVALDQRHWCTKTACKMNYSRYGNI